MSIARGSLRLPSKSSKASARRCNMFDRPTSSQTGPRAPSKVRRRTAFRRCLSPAAIALVPSNRPSLPWAPPHRRANHASWRRLHPRRHSTPSMRAPRRPSGAARPAGSTTHGPAAGGRQRWNPVGDPMQYEAATRVLPQAGDPDASRNAPRRSARASARRQGRARPHKSQCAPTESTHFSPPCAVGPHAQRGEWPINLSLA